MKIRLLIFVALICPLSVQASTVLYDNGTVVVDDVLADPNDLWVGPADLTRVNGFELKTEGQNIFSFSHVDFRLLLGLSVCF